MTKAKATPLKIKWKKQGGSHCEHAIQELVSSDLDHGHVVNFYHCRDCGELIAHRFKAKHLSNIPSIEAECFDDMYEVF